MIHTDAAPLPFLSAECVRALGSTLSEALRNSRLHAGPDALRTVTATLAGSGIRIEFAETVPGSKPPQSRSTDSVSPSAFSAECAPYGQLVFRGHTSRRRHKSAPGTGSRMTHNDKDIFDVRELLGLRTIAAKTVVTAYAATFALVAGSANPPGGGWFEFAAWIIVSTLALGLTLVPATHCRSQLLRTYRVRPDHGQSDLLPSPRCRFDGLLQLWPLAASTAIYTCMCIRGCTVWAWIGMTTALASCMIWAEHTGQSAAYGLSMSANSLAPLLIATFFAWTIRPVAHEIFALRRQARVRAAAARAALARGVEVVSLDDHAMDTAPEEVPDRVIVIQAAHVGIDVSIDKSSVPGFPVAPASDISPQYWNLHATKRNLAEFVYSSDANPHQALTSERHTGAIDSTLNTSETPDIWD